MHHFSCSCHHCRSGRRQGQREAGYGIDGLASGAAGMVATPLAWLIAVTAGVAFSVLPLATLALAWLVASRMGFGL